MGQVLYDVLLAFLLLLIVRGIMSWVFALSRFRPTGVVAALMEIVYSLTDPVLRPLERLLPPVRLGGTALSLAYPVAWTATVVLMNVARQL